MQSLGAPDVIRLLDLKPHPEGGYYSENFRDPNGPASGRSFATAIYYLLDEGGRSHWHRVKGSAEIWHHYAGGSLSLMLSPDGKTVETHRLGSELMNGEEPQLVVPAGCWQSAETVDGWSLLGCTVAPGFEFSDFEMAPPGWQPAGDRSG